MSAAAPTANTNTVPRFIGRAITSSLGAKVLMALSGLGLFLWLIAHLAGNLGVFAGRETENEYAHFLKSHVEILWGQRVLVIAGFVVHIVSGVRLAALNRAARPQEYQFRRWRKATWMSRTMLVTGLIVLGFLTFHLLHFTGGYILSDFYANAPADKNIPADVFGMVVRSFRIPWVVALYVVGVSLVGFHLSHGIWSGLQTLGLNGKRWTPFAQAAGVAIAVLLALAFASIPLGVILGAVGKP